MNSRAEITVVYAGTDSDTAEQVAESLERESDRAVVEGVAEPHEISETVDAANADCVVVDHDAPQQNGIEVLETVRASYPDLPVILLTDEELQAVASDALSAGVTDYLSKAVLRDQPAILTRRVLEAAKRYQSIQEIDRREDLFTKTQDIADVGAWEYDIETDTYYNTDEVFRLHGLPPDEQMWMEKSLDYYHPDDRPAIREAFEKAVESGEPYDLECRLITEEGEKRWVRARGEPQTDNGEVVRVRGTIQDITERRQREKELETVLERMDDAVFVHDEAGSFTFVNQTAVERHGYEESKLYEMQPQDLAVETDAEEVSNRIEQIKREGGVVFETRHGTASGEEFPVELNATPITFRGKPSILSIARDITERKEQERELRKLKNRYQSFVEYSSDIITVIDEEGKVTYQNPAVERIIGYGPETRQGERIFEYIHPDDRQQALTAFENLLSQDSEASERVELRYQDPDGSYRWLESVAVDRTDTEIDGILIYSRDVTERKEREAQLQQYKQVVESTKDQIAAVDEELTYLFANQAYRQFRDLGSGAVTDTSLEDILSESGMAKVRPKIERALDGRPVQAEIDASHPNKGERVLDMRLFPLERPDGDIYGVGIAIRDTTEEKEREAKIERESEIRRLFSEVNHTLVRRTDIEEVITRTVDLLGSSNLFECTFGYLRDIENTKVACSSDSELPPSKVDEFHTQEYLDRVFDADFYEIEDVTDEPFNQHGQQRPSHSGVAVPISHEGEQYGVLTVHLPPDETVTDEERAVLETVGNDIGYFIFNQLLQSEHKSFTEIVERIDDPVMLQNRDGTYRVVNQAVADLAGRPKEALVGQRESVFMDRETAETIEKMKDRVLTTEEPLSYQLSPTFPDGTERTFATARYPYYDSDGQLDGTIAICRDVTDLEQHKRQLQVLDRVLRHNLRNNMNVITGHAEVIADEAAGKTAEHAAKITETSERLLALSQKQRDITQFLSESHTIRQIDIRLLVENLAVQVGSTHPNAEIKISGGQEQQVSALSAIEQAIEELLTNSVVHADHPDPVVSVQIGATDDTVQVRISDENSRISEMDKDILFGNEQLTNLRHGSGLGLWLVRLIVDYSKGTIRYEPNQPRGNVVILELDRA